MIKLKGQSLVQEIFCQEEASVGAPCLVETGCSVAVSEAAAAEIVTFPVIVSSIKMSNYAVMRTWKLPESTLNLF